MIPLVVIGGSAGGFEPLREIVKGLPSNFPAGVLAVIHTAPSGPGLMPRLLSRAGMIPAVHASDGEVIQAGRVYVAPPDHHLTVEDGAMRVHRGPRFNGHRPSIDALFESAAISQTDVVGVLLSGMDSDGPLGLKAVFEAGGVTIVQSVDEATFPHMIARALTLLQPHFQLPASEIAATLWNVVAELRAGFETGNSEVNEAEGDDKTPTGYSCPECGGVLWQNSQDRRLAYECRVGHVYSHDSLLNEQTLNIEKALWMGLRALEEKQSLLHRLAADTEGRGLSHSAGRFREAARALAEPASTLRKLLGDETLYDLPQAEQDS